MKDSLPNMKYVLLGDGNNYYGGSTYIFQGQYFPVQARMGTAKRYKSRKVAENSAKSLSEKVGESFVVVEVEE